MISLIFLALAHNVSTFPLILFFSTFPPPVCTYSLSVSNINSMATVSWEDFLSTRYKNVKDKQQLNAIKYLAFIYAVIVLGIAYCVGFLSGIIESAMLTGSATTGPLVGAFLLAMLVPIANSKVKKKMQMCVNLRKQKEKKKQMGFVYFMFCAECAEIVSFRLLHSRYFQGVIAGMIASHACTLILICGSYTIARSADVVLPTSTEVINFYLYIILL